MSTVATEQLSAPRPSIPDVSAPQGLSRRTFLTLTAAAGGGLAVAVAIGGPGSTAAASLPAGSAVRSALVPDLAVAALPVVYGTPTDVARIRPGWWWSRDTDGTVVVFDRDRGRWRAGGRQDWAGVVAAGSAILTRWGRPSGRRELMLVSGPDPGSGPVPPTSPDPTPPSSPAPSSPDATTAPVPSTSPVPSTPATTSSAAAGVPPTGATPVTPTPVTGRTVPRVAARASGTLPNTGYDPSTTVGLALAALAAGGGLLVAARGRGRRDPARRSAESEQGSVPPRE